MILFKTTSLCSIKDYIYLFMPKIAKIPFYEIATLRPQ